MSLNRIFDNGNGECYESNRFMMHSLRVCESASIPSIINLTSINQVPYYTLPQPLSNHYLVVNENLTLEWKPVPSLVAMKASCTSSPDAYQAEPTNINFNNMDINRGSVFVSSQTYFTVLVDGIYSVRFHTTLSKSSSPVLFQVYVDTTPYGYHKSLNGDLSPQTVDLFDMVQVSAGQTISIKSSGISGYGEVYLEQTYIIIS